MEDEYTIVLPHTIPVSMHDDLADEIKHLLSGTTVTVAKTPQESLAVAPETDILVSYEIPDGFLERADNLRWIQALSAGVDKYDIERIQNREIVLTNASGVHANPMAEQVLGSVLLFERNILRGIRQQQAHTWERYSAGELQDKTLGVIGVGAIGSRVAEVAAKHGMMVIGTKRTPETGPDFMDEIYPPAGLYEVLSRADYLIIACPLTDETEGLLGEREFDRMRSEAVLINISRGQILHQEHLVQALQEGTIGGAALDTFVEEPLPEDSPLWDMGNVVVTPHMAGMSPHLNRRKGALFAENFQSFTAGKSLTNRIV